MRPKVLFVSGREREYIRNRVLIEALGHHFELHVLTSSASSTVSRIIHGLGRFVTSHADHDVCFVGFYGQPLAIALSKLHHKPIILDAYVSTFDTLCEDRRWFPPRSPVGRLARWIDQESCQVASAVLTDTNEHARYFAERFGVQEAKLKTVYVGCDERIFHERNETYEDPHKVEVFYYGAFLPLHGTEVIIEAANLLRHLPHIHFTIGGEGPRYRAARARIDELSLGNIDLAGWIPIEQIPAYIARASVCLGGHFSTIPKAARVISTKTFQFIAMGKATIIGDSPATRELFTPWVDACSVRMGSPAELAQAIATLSQDAALRQRLGTAARRLFHRQLRTEKIATQLADIIREVLAQHTVGSNERDLRQYRDRSQTVRGKGCQ